MEECISPSITVQTEFDKRVENGCNNWITGYADGAFKPYNNITRAGVVAIINRETDTKYVNKNLSSLNRFDDLTDTGYWAYYYNDRQIIHLYKYMINSLD